MYQFTGRPIPDEGIVRLFVLKAQAHLQSADRNVEEGNAGPRVIDNGNKCLWVLLPIRRAENVQAYPANRRNTNQVGASQGLGR